MSRLAAFHLSELRFGKFGRLKDGSYSCLAQFNPRESENLQSIKNRIHNMIFSHYAQEPWNSTSWRLRDINFQGFPNSTPAPHWLTVPYQFPTVSSLAKFYRSYFGQESLSPSQIFSVGSLLTVTYSFEFFFNFEKFFKING